MISFDLNAFLIENRLSILELSKKVTTPFQSLYYAKKNRKVSARLLRKLESKFGDLSAYIKSPDSLNPPANLEISLHPSTQQGLAE